MAVGRTEIATNTTTSYCYDTIGNMVSRTTGGTTQSMLYDIEGRLRLMVGGSVNSGFAYDGDGNRVRATLSSTNTTFYAGLVEYQLNPSTGLGAFRDYYTVGGKRVALRINNSSLYYFLQDHLGSTSVTINVHGNEKGCNRYTAWGEDRFHSGSTLTDYQYTGQVNDQETGLYYYGAGYYDPALHRFIQADTIVPGLNNPQMLNRYTYTLNMLTPMVTSLENLKPAIPSLCIYFLK